VAGPTLSVELHRTYSRGPSIAAVFDLDLGAAQTLILFGPSGAGKTTVLRCLAGLERPDGGRITLGPETWFDRVRGVSLAPQRRQIGYLPQGLALFPHLDVRANVAFGAVDLPDDERAAHVAELLSLLNLVGLEHRRPGQLSAGQQQRVALARALCRRPRLLLLDEPLSALDTPTRETLRSELRDLLRAGGVPAIAVTHDRSEALALGDRVGVMVGGAVRQLGPTLEVFDRPADESVARILGVETVMPATVLEAARGLLRLRVGRAELAAVGDHPVGASVIISIRAEDVILLGASVDTAVAASARNRLPGRVVSIEPAGPLVRVRIDCGFPLVAAVTRPAIDELDLGPGASVAAMVKAPAVHVIG